MTWRLTHGIILVLFVLICLLLFVIVQLSGSPRDAQINKAVPTFTLAGIAEGQEGFGHTHLADGQWSLVNIWASWCAPCRVEHPYLMALAQAGVKIYGLNYKDTPAQAQQFLNTFGNPYHRAGRDENGRAALGFGIYGIPETFVVDGKGYIQARYQGALSAETSKELMSFLPKFLAQHD